MAIELDNPASATGFSSHGTPLAVLERARRYLAAIPPAVAGQGGDSATWQAARALAGGFRLPLGDSGPLFLEWNARCSPPWSVEELCGKLRRAGQQPGGGWLLDARPPRRAPAAPAVPATPAEKRRAWPPLRAPVRADLETIAALRHVSAEAAYLLSLHQHLWRCRWRGEECYVLRSGTFAQARRMDGRPFESPGKSPLKTLNLPGSEGRFLHPGGPGAPDVPILLTEGPAGLLESVEALLRADHARGALHSVSLMAAVSAGSRFTEEHLASLAGHHVRLLPDNDAPGQAAAAAWATALRRAGCTVDGFRLPDGMKDLGDCLQKLTPDDPFWARLFVFP